MATMVDDVPEGEPPVGRVDAAVLGQSLLHQAGSRGVERAAAGRGDLAPVPAPAAGRGRAAAAGRGRGRRRRGITKDKFTPAAWSKATVRGRYTRCRSTPTRSSCSTTWTWRKKAGLLNAAGDDLKPIKGRDDFVDALKAMKQASGAVRRDLGQHRRPGDHLALVHDVVLGPGRADRRGPGHEGTIDAAALEETFAFMQSLTGPLGLMPRNATDTTVTTLFSEGKAGFLFDGEWQIPTYTRRQAARRQAARLQRRAVPGHPRDQAGRLRRLALPGHPEEPGPVRRSGRRTPSTFIKGLLDDSSIWSDGGHIPAWLPVQTEQGIPEQKPQSNYIQAAFNAVYDPPGLVHRRRFGLPERHGRRDHRGAGRADQPAQRRQRDDRQPEDVLDRHAPGAARNTDDRHDHDRSRHRAVPRHAHARGATSARSDGRSDDNRRRLAVRHAVPGLLRPVPDRPGASSGS